ncbi:hypothetical protein BKA67DRAFT_569075 [Truncatella angustata]|uniref:Zn(2)-C6 fungal-type domain-containing protein n=1 Tax=Truncatella angustata TaxID=152316 RepID=A0A9P8UJF4_9PEZI|nr:uncharacterized protein BKA67DRAFT_569075 [Truncatella angustata]KAH6653274.1 hypothetical protein BKA67DRAFT_569075 [Truncatella angustata]
MKSFKITTPALYEEKRSARLPDDRQSRSSSCRTCRDLRIRCDRGLPCSNCRRRGWRESCHYRTGRKGVQPIPCDSDQQQPHQTQRQPQEGQHTQQQQLLHLSETTRAPAGATEEMLALRSRIEQLEMALGRASCPSTSSETSRPGGGPETSSQVEADSRPQRSVPKIFLRESAGEVQFIGSTHWAFLLREFPYLSQFLAKDTAFRHSQTALLRIESIIDANCTTPLTMTFPCNIETRRRDLLNCFPDQETAESLTANYFRSIGFVLPVVLCTSFFPVDKSLAICNGAEMLWLLQLTMIFACGFLIDGVPDGLRLSLNARQNNAKRLVKIVETIILNDSSFRKPSIMLLQVLLLLISAKIMLSVVDGPDGLCGLLGMAAKLSFSLGLHRDPACFDGLSSFDMERRRQLWAILRFMDLDYSMQMGVPHLINDDESDCRLPSASLEERLTLMRSPEALGHRWSDDDTRDKLLHSLAKLTCCCAKVHTLITATGLQSSLDVAKTQKAMLKCELEEARRVLSHAILFERERSLSPSSQYFPNPEFVRRFYEVFFSTMYNRMCTVLYQPFLLEDYNMDVAWPEFLGAAMSILTDQQQLTTWYPYTVSEWWSLGQTFWKNDVCRAIFCLCHGVCQRQLASLRLPATVQHTPTNIAILGAIATAKESWTRNIPLGINYVKSYKLICVVVASTQAVVHNEPKLARMVQSANESMQLALSTLQSSLENDPVDYNTSHTTNNYSADSFNCIGFDRRSADAQMHDITGNDDSIFFSNTHGTREVCGLNDWSQMISLTEFPEWEWFDQLNWNSKPSLSTSQETGI